MTRSICEQKRQENSVIDEGIWLFSEFWIWRGTIGRAAPLRAVAPLRGYMYCPPRNYQMAIAAPSSVPFAMTEFSWGSLDAKALVIFDSNKDHLGYFQHVIQRISHWCVFPLHASHFLHWCLNIQSSLFVRIQEQLLNDSMKISGILTISLWAGTNLSQSSPSTGPNGVSCYMRAFPVRTCQRNFLATIFIDRVWCETIKSPSIVQLHVMMDSSAISFEAFAVASPASSVVKVGNLLVDQSTSESLE
jgi:hypothetical protein